MLRTSTSGKSSTSHSVDRSSSKTSREASVERHDDAPSMADGLNNRTEIQNQTTVEIGHLLRDALTVTAESDAPAIHSSSPEDKKLHKDEALITQAKADYKSEKEFWVTRFKTDGKFRQNILLFNQKHQELVKAIDGGQVNAAGFKERGKELGTLLMRALGMADENELPQPTINPAKLLGRAVGLTDLQGWTQQTKDECQEAGRAYALPSIKLNWESQTPNIVRSSLNLGLAIAKEFMPDASWELDVASSAVNYAYVAAQLGVSIVGPFSNAGAQSAAVARQAQWGPKFVPNVNSSKRIDEKGGQQVLRSPARVKYELMELKQLKADLESKKSEEKGKKQRLRVEQKLQRFEGKAETLLKAQEAVLKKAKAGRSVPKAMEDIFTKTSETTPDDSLANKLLRLEALSNNKKKPLILSAEQRKELVRLIDDIKLWRTFETALEEAGFHPDDDLIHDDPEPGAGANRTLNKAIGMREHELAVCECYEQLNVLFWQGVGRTCRNVLNGAGAGLGLAINLRKSVAQQDSANAPEGIGGTPEPGPQPVPTPGLPGSPVPVPSPLVAPEPGPQPTPDAQLVPQPEPANDTLIESELEPAAVPLPSPSASDFWSNATSFMTPQNALNATSAVVAGAAYALADKTGLILQGAYLGTVCAQPIFYHLTQGTFTGWDYQSKLATQAQIIAMTGTGNLNPVHNPKAAPISDNDIVEGIHLKKISGLVKGTMAIRFEHLKLAIDFDGKVYKQSLLAFLADAGKDKGFHLPGSRLATSRKDMEAASQRFQLERELQRQEFSSRVDLREALSQRTTSDARREFVRSLLDNARPTGSIEVVVDGENASLDNARETSVLNALDDYERALKGVAVRGPDASSDSDDADGKGKGPEISPKAKALKQLIRELMPDEDQDAAPLVYTQTKTFTFGYGDLSEAFDACTVSAKEPKPGESVTAESLKAANTEAERQSVINRDRLVNNLLEALEDYESGATDPDNLSGDQKARRAAVLSILAQYEANLITAKAAADGDLDKLLGDTSTLSEEGKEMIVGALHYASVPRHLPAGHEGYDAAQDAMKKPEYQRAKDLDDMLANAKGRTERLTNINNGHQVSQKLGQYFAYFIAGSGAPMVIKALANLAAEAVVAYNGFDYDNTEELTTFIRAAGNSVSIMGSVMAIGLGFAYQKYIRQKNEFRQRDDMAALPAMVNSSSLHIGSRDFLTRISDDWLSQNKVTYFRTLVTHQPDTGKANPTIPEIEFVPYTNLPSDMWTQMFAADLHIIPRVPGDAIPGQVLGRLWGFMRATKGELSSLNDAQLAEALSAELRLLKKDVVEQMNRDEQFDEQVPAAEERLFVPPGAPHLPSDQVVQVPPILNESRTSGSESTSNPQIDMASAEPPDARVRKAVDRAIVDASRYGLWHDEPLQPDEREARVKELAEAAHQNPASLDDAIGTLQRAQQGFVVALRTEGVNLDEATLLSVQQSHDLIDAVLRRLDDQPV